VPKNLGATSVRCLSVAVLVALGVVPLANLLSHGPYIPWWRVAVVEWVVSGTAIILIALGVARVLGERFDRLFARAQAAVLAPSPVVFQVLVGLGVLALTTVFTFYCFARAPFAQDEMAQRFQARILLAGRLAAMGEAHPEFFSITGVLDQGGRWYSMYPMGGPLLLAGGMALHAVWLVNPVLTAVTACALYRLAARAFGEGPGRASALLFGLSPFVLIMGASEMNHVGALALTVIALAALTSWATATDADRTTRSAALIGLAIGGVATIRPLDGVLVAVTVGVFQVSVLARERWRARSLVAQMLAGALPATWLLYANARTTGAPLLFAYEALYGPAHRLGYHLDPNGVAFTPLRALIVASANFMRLDRFLFEWPVPGVLPVLAGLLALRRPERWDFLMLGLIGATVGGYALYWSDSFFAGPRFLYTAVPAFIVIVARAPGLVAARLGPGTARRASLALVPLCLAYAWAMPIGASSVQRDVSLYHAGRTKLKTDIGGEVDAAHLSRALVFVHESWRARLEARLEALGLRPGDADQVLNTSDACQIETALAGEDVRPATDTAGRRDRLFLETRPQTPVHPVMGLQADEALFVAEGSVLTDACRSEIAQDSLGVTPFAPFLALASFEPDGSLGGPVVFARDMGPMNERLSARFPDRTWLRYRARQSLSDTTPAIGPY
jgi:hypothetical protein